MIDWRVTPSLDASLSSDSIIQVGKSTFTLFCTWLGRLILDRSKEPVMSFPLSKSESNFLAFIQLNFLSSRSSNRYDANVFTAVRDNSRPVLRAYFPDHQKSGLID